MRAQIVPATAEHIAAIAGDARQADIVQALLDDALITPHEQV